MLSQTPNSPSSLLHFSLEQHPTSLTFSNSAAYQQQQQHPGLAMDPTDCRGFYPYTPNEVKHRKRTNPSQLMTLESVFKRDTKPNGPLRVDLATRLGMTPRGVQVSCPYLFIFSTRLNPFRFGSRTGTLCSSGRLSATPNLFKKISQTSEGETKGRQRTQRSSEKRAISRRCALALRRGVVRGA